MALVADYASDSSQEASLTEPEVVIRAPIFYSGPGERSVLPAVCYMLADACYLFSACFRETIGPAAADEDEGGHSQDSYFVGSGSER